MRVLPVADYRERARRRLPRFLFDYVDGGSYDEVTLAANRADLAAVRLRQRVLRDVSRIDSGCTLFGRRFSMPVGLAPVGLAGMYARRGEIQAVRAAEAQDVPFALSTVSVCTLDEVARAASRPFWFQLYMVRDRAFMADLLAEGARLGCDALVFTVDMPVPGARYRDYRSGLAGATGLGVTLRRFVQAAAHPRWAWNVGVRGRPHTLGNVAPVLKGRTGLEDFMAWMGANFDPSVTWADLDWVRERWPGKLVIKGVLDVDDAREVAAIGADGLVVSNHGGRQLDGAASVARALPAIARALGDRLTIVADGGVRSGLDVMRLLALGADAVLVGRPWAYALAAGGEAAVGAMLEAIRRELHAGMALTGCRELAEITPDIIDTGP